MGFFKLITKVMVIVNRRKNFTAITMLCILGLTLLAACKDEPEQPASTPTVAITAADLMQGVEDTVTFTFSEDVMGFTADSITVTGGSKGAFASTNAKVYTLQVTPTTSGSKALTVSVAANAATTAAGGKNNKTEQAFNVAPSKPIVTKPTVAITADNFMQGIEGAVTITFSQGVTGFTADAITVTGGSKGTFALVNNSVYTLNVTPSASGSKALTVSVAADVATTTAGGKNNKTEQTFDVTIFYHNVMLVLNGGRHDGNNNGVEIEVSHGQLLELPADPITYPAVGNVTRTFVRWELNGQPYNLTQPVMEDITLSAVWENSCDIEETKHPKTKAELQSLITGAIAQNPTVDLNYIDVSAITEMSTIFSAKLAFNGNISCWNVGRVTDMSGMFLDASAFNQDISNWDVSKVTNMAFMFSGATAFNKNIGAWNVSQVTNMTSMFSRAAAFNQDIGKWDVSQVTNMISMFSGARAFNKNIGAWNVSQVTNMTSMFSGARAFNQDIGAWNVSKVTNMTSMFATASAFDQDLSGWNVRNVTLYNNALANSGIFGKTAKHPNFREILQVTFVLNGGTYSGDNPVKVREDNAISAVPGPVTYPAVNDVTRTLVRWELDERPYDLKQPVTRSITLNAVWKNSCGIEETKHPKTKFELQNVLSGGNLNNIDVSAITDMNNLFPSEFRTTFNSKMGCWNVSRVTNMKRLFSGLMIFNQDIGQWDVSKVTNMDNMFNEAAAFNQDIGKWNVGRVTNMYFMFSGATAFNQNIGGWDVSRVTNMTRMFQYGTAFNQNIGSWDVSRVTLMTSMFFEASAFDQDLSKWNVDKVTNHFNIFAYSAMASKTAKQPKFK